MAIHKVLRDLAILVCITAAVAAVGQQPPMSVSLNPAAYQIVDGTAFGLPGSQAIPASNGLKALRASKDYGIDPTGFRRITDPGGFGIPDHLHSAQSYSICIIPDGFGIIPVSRETER